jgi:predicted adenine nucleotide alpha hydrolase (AANH) superfamily ATPase
LLKTGFFKQVRELKIQRKNLGGPLAENRFLQAGKGAENTKEKSRRCFTI